MTETQILNMVLLPTGSRRSLRFRLWHVEVPEAKKKGNKGGGLDRSVFGVFVGLIEHPLSLSCGGALVQSFCKHLHRRYGWIRVLLPLISFSRMCSPLYCWRLLVKNIGSRLLVHVFFRLFVYRQTQYVWNCRDRDKERTVESDCEIALYIIRARLGWRDVAGVCLFMYGTRYTFQMMFPLVILGGLL